MTENCQAPLSSSLLFWAKAKLYDKSFFKSSSCRTELASIRNERTETTATLFHIHQRLTCMAMERKACCSVLSAWAWSVVVVVANPRVAKRRGRTRVNLSVVVVVVIIMVGDAMVVCWIVKMMRRDFSRSAEFSYHANCKQLWGGWFVAPRTNTFFAQQRHQASCFRLSSTRRCSSMTIDIAGISSVEHFMQDFEDATLNE